MNKIQLIKTGIQQLSLTELNELSAFINDVKVIARDDGPPEGLMKVITKIMQSKCLVDMLGRVYRVPMSMLEAA